MDRVNQWLTILNEFNINPVQNKQPLNNEAF